MVKEKYQSVVKKDWIMKPTEHAVRDSMIYTRLLYERLMARENEKPPVLQQVAKIQFLRESCGVFSAAENRVSINTIPEVKYVKSKAK